MKKNLLTTQGYPYQKDLPSIFLLMHKSLAGASNSCVTLFKRSQHFRFLAQMTVHVTDIISGKFFKGRVCYYWGLFQVVPIKAVEIRQHRKREHPSLHSPLTGIIIIHCITEICITVLREECVGVVLTGFLCRLASRQVPVAQWLACWTSNSKVVGSSPTRDAFFCFFQLVER